MIFPLFKKDNIALATIQDGKKLKYTICDGEKV